MGHTSGLGKGFAMILFAAIAVACIIGALAYGFASLFNHPLVNVGVGALAVGAFAYWFYQPRVVVLYLGFCGGMGGGASYLVLHAMGGIVGGLVGMLAGAFVTLLLIVVGAFGNKSKGEAVSWRQSKKRDDK
jgi:hypothetical protein